MEVEFLATENRANREAILLSNFVTTFNKTEKLAPPTAEHEQSSQGRKQRKGAAAAEGEIMTLKNEPTIFSSFKCVNDANSKLNHEMIPFIEIFLIKREIY